MSMAWRPLIENGDDFSLPGVWVQRSRNRQALVWLDQGDSSLSHSPSLQHSKIASFYGVKNKTNQYLYSEIHRIHK